MPRKDDIKKNRSKNDRASENRKYDADSTLPHISSNDMANVLQYSSPGAFIARNMTGANNYSEFVKNANVNTDGWYSTFANGIWGLKDLHNALLGRDSAKDYLQENGLDWSDMEGYNDAKLLGRASSGVGGLVHQGSTWLNNIGSDLGKLYSQQRS